MVQKNTLGAGKQEPSPKHVQNLITSAVSQIHCISFVILVPCPTESIDVGSNFFFFFVKERERLVSLWKMQSWKNLETKDFQIGLKSQIQIDPICLSLSAVWRAAMLALIALLGFREFFKVIGTGCAPRSSFFLNVEEKP